MFFSTIFKISYVNWNAFDAAID